MFTPEMDSGPPPLVDAHPSFIPPPHGASNGGHPGVFDPFPGARGDGGGYQPSSSWVPPHGTPYPSAPQQLPGGWPTSPIGPPNSAPGWTFGNYPPAGTPVWGPAPPPAANSYSPWGAQTPTSPWGPQTPGGGGGGGGYNPFPGYGPGPSGSGPATPYPAQGPGTLFESSVGQPITGGWGGGGTAAWGAAGGSAAWGGGGVTAGWGAGGAAPVWGDGGWVVQGQYKEKKKKRKSDHKHRSYDYDYEDDTYMQRSTSMRRSNSHEPPSRSSSLHRSASWGNSAGGAGAFPGWYGGGFGGASGPSTPAYAQGDQFDEHNLARRPRDWRPDFSVKPGIAAYIPKLGGNRSTVREYNDPIRRALHPLLTYDPAHPPISYDTRTSPFSQSSIEFLNLRRPPNPIDFAQLALQPTCAFMRLYHPRFPWYIDVHQSQPNGVTVGDVLAQVTAQLHVPIHGRHFWNEELGEAERTAVTLAFQERVREDRGRLVPRGILQVDFFGRRVVLEGLVRGAKGMWEMRMRKVDH